MEQLDRLEAKLDALIDAFADHRVATQRELGRRPTRTEIYGVAVVLGSIIGAVVGKL